MTVEQILELASELSPSEQQQLLEELQSRAMSQDTTSGKSPYDTLLNLAGSAHSDYQDVSMNKHQHLGETGYQFKPGK